MLGRTADFEVLPENWEILDLFLRLQTQWKAGAMGGALGLDYSGVEAMFRILGVRNKAEKFAMIQDMEHAALRVLNAPKG